jgi:AP2 domain
MTTFFESILQFSHLREIMKKIELTQGQYALVDDADYDSLCVHKWTAVKRENGKYYAVRSIGPRENRRHVKMEWDIMGRKRIDHKDGNGLNNQRASNLRPYSGGQNNQNRRKLRPTSSQYKGVYYNKRDKAFVALIRSPKKQIVLGRFGHDEIAAAKAYDHAALAMFGEFANLNFPVVECLSVSNLLDAEASETS